MARRVIALCVVALGVLCVAPAANGAFEIEDWSAITCSENSDTPKLGDPPVVGIRPLPKDPEQCTEGTPDKWYTQAAGHPPFAFTDFTLNTLDSPGAIGFPDGFVHEIVVDTPEGLSVNPEAVPQCLVEDLEANKCSPASMVGVNYFTVALEGPKPGPIPCAGPAGNCLQARVAVPVYNLVPFDEVPSMVGFLGTTGPTFIVGSLDPVDQHVTFTISDIHSPPTTPGAPPVVGSRLVFNGRAGNGTYLTMPSNCAAGTDDDPQRRISRAAEPGADRRRGVHDGGRRHRMRSSPVQTDVASRLRASSVDSPEATTVEVRDPV